MLHSALWLVLAAGGPPELGRIGVFRIGAAGVDAAAVSVTVDAVARTASDLGVADVITTAELDALLDAQRTQDLVGCSDVSCLVDIGAAAGVDRLVTGTLSRSGETLTLGLQLVNVRFARVENRVSLGAAAPAAVLGELAAAATEALLLPGERLRPGRIVLGRAPVGLRWTVDGRDAGGTETAADVGAHVLRLEARGFEPARRVVVVRSGRTTTVDAALAPSASQRTWGFGVQTGALVPDGAAYHSSRAGVGGAVSFLGELSVLGIQPRLSLYYGPGTATDASYFDASGDVGVLWMPLTTFVAPFVGVGLGGRYLYARGNEVTSQHGSIVVVTQRTTPTWSHFGLAGFGRVGAVFLNGMATRIIASADYTIASYGEGNRPQALIFALGVLL